MDYMAFIIPLIIVIIFSSVMSIIYKDKEKVDKGFTINFFRLSYRRRIIRDLSGIPFAVIILFLLYYFELVPFDIFLIILSIAALIYVFEVGYNYRMWKKHEREMNNISD